MSEQLYRMTRTSKAPEELRLVVTSTGQTLNLAPGDVTIVGQEVIAVIESDKSVQAHFAVAPVSESVGKMQAATTIIKAEPKTDD